MRPLAAAALLALASPAGAQVFRGVVVDAVTGAPINGGIVVLLDASTAQRAGGFTDSQGRFELRAPGPGRWRVRAEHIGHLSAMTPLIDIAAGGVHDVRLALPRMTVQLSTIRVTGERQCVIHPDSGAETARLWEAVRTALRGTALTREQAQLGLRIATFDRELDSTGVERWSSSRERTTFTLSPFVSVPIEELERDGFVVDSGDELHYRLPDAPVLLSERFLGTHCFRLTEAEEHDALIGLAFEPVRGRRLPDVRGVLWVDRGSAELRRMEVWFANVRPSVIEEHAGGDIEFRRLPTGHWIVGRWAIRMPLVRAHRITNLDGLHLRTDTVLHAIREQGGEVLEILPARRVTHAPGRITGAVFDSTRGAPLAGARVFISGTSHATTTGADGSFVLDGVPGGDHTVSFTHPRLDSLATVGSAVGVGIAGADTTRVELATPSWRTLVRNECGDTLAAGLGAIKGRIRSAGDGRPIEEAHVTVIWTTAAGGRGAARRGRIDALTSRSGAYRACGIPEGARTRVIIGAFDHAPVELTVNVRAEELTRLDRALPREPGRIHRPPPGQ